MNSYSYTTSSDYFGVSDRKTSSDHFAVSDRKNGVVFYSNDPYRGRVSISSDFIDWKEDGSGTISRSNQGEILWSSGSYFMRMDDISGFEVKSMKTGIIVTYTRNFSMGIDVFSAIGPNGKCLTLTLLET